MATGEAFHLLLKFVNTNSDIADTQWDRRMSPKLLFNPYSERAEEKNITAHYFLLVSSILEDRIVGFSENARRLLIHLHKALGSRLFEIRKPHLFEEEIVKCGFYGELGPRKEAIPEVLTSINFFVKDKAEKNKDNINSIFTAVGWSFFRQRLCRFQHQLPHPIRLN